MTVILDKMEKTMYKPKIERNLNPSYSTDIKCSMGETVLDDFDLIAYDFINVKHKTYWQPSEYVVDNVGPVLTNKDLDSYVFEDLPKPDMNSYVNTERDGSKLRKYWEPKTEDKRNTERTPTKLAYTPKKKSFWKRIFSKRRA